MLKILYEREQGIIGWEPRQNFDIVVTKEIFNEPLIRLAIRNKDFIGTIFTAWERQTNKLTKQMTIAKNVIYNNEEVLNNYVKHWLALNKKQIELQFEKAKLQDEFYTFCCNEYEKLSEKETAKKTLRKLK